MTSMLFYQMVNIQFLSLIFLKVLTQLITFSLKHFLLLVSRTQHSPYFPPNLLVTHSWFPLLSSSLPSLMSTYHYTSMLMTLKRVSPAWTFPLNSRLIYPTTCSTFPVGCPIGILNLIHPNSNLGFPLPDIICW